MSSTSASIIHGRARFEFVTEGALRIEWSATAAFEGKRSLSVAARKGSKIEVKRKVRGDRVQLCTPVLSVEYCDDGSALSEQNLKVSWRRGGMHGVWHPGLEDNANLRGTARTLDGIHGGEVKLGAGFVSRSGWSFVDDSKTPLCGDDGWVEPRHEQGYLDYYLFTFGLEYQTALREAALVFGHQPLPPRYALGYWWSRYWAYTDKELEQLVQSFERFQIPLDVLVVDMDWHLEGWTGYTWDTRYFPDPADFIAWVKSKGLRCTLNLHPAKGVAAHEQAFPAMKRALGIAKASTAPIAFDCTDQRYMRQYFSQLHHPLEKLGVDFWWIDWQQGKESKIPGLDPLAWLNRVHFEDNEKQHPRERGLILSRFGGLGAGRYPIGFSGDTNSDWESLRYQPYFTANSANALYGYWSHDIGGHHSEQMNPELFLRWMQYGCYSPILRTHTSKHPCAERRAWAYPAPFADMIIAAIRRRYELVPYVYTENRRSFDSAVSLCHPLYYHFAKHADAYECPEQYFFGKSMIVAPITAPADPSSETASKKIWIPPGEWFEESHGILNKGPRWIVANYLHDEVPIFFRSDCIIPSQFAPQRLARKSYRALVLTIPPGKSGEYDLYEDDGISKEYLKGSSVLLPLRYSWRGNTLVIRIGPAIGRYPGYQAKKELTLRIPAISPPTSVRHKSRKLAWSHRERAGFWSYDGDMVSTVVLLGVINVRKLNKVEIVYAKKRRVEGLKGVLNKLKLMHRHANAALDFKILHPEERLSAELAQTGNRISRDPKSFDREIRNMKSTMTKLPKVFVEMLEKLENEERRASLRKAVEIVSQLNQLLSARSRK